jgi:integrase
LATAGRKTRAVLHRTRWGPRPLHRAAKAASTEMRILTDAEYQAILGAINPHYRLLVRTLWATEMRWGEVLAIRPDAVYKRNGRWYVKVRRTMAQVGGRLTIRDFGKTKNAMREISIPVDLARDLIDLGLEGFKSMRGAAPPGATSGGRGSVPSARRASRISRGSTTSGTP